MSKHCLYCQRDDVELRPYGPGGAWLCFGCMRADPARERVAQDNFGALLGAAESGGGGVAVATLDGPQPFESEDEPDRGDA